MKSHKSRSYEQDDTASYTKRLLFVLGMFLVLGVPIVINNIAQSQGEVPLKQKAAVADAATTSTKDYFANLTLSAQAAYVVDLTNNKVLYAKNENEVLPLASLTKVMTTAVASELVPQDTTVTITPADIAQDGDSGLYSGEHWKLSDLIRFTLVESSNDGAHAIAAVVGSQGQRSYGMSDQASIQTFVGDMNQKAASLGLTGMHFNNATGLDVSTTTSGGYGNAKDMSKLAAYLLKYHSSLFMATTQPTFSVQSLDGYTHTAHNTDEDVSNYPGLLASKTGYTDLAGGNLTVIINAGLAHPVSVTVLGSTYQNRFSDVNQLVWATIDSLSTPDVATSTPAT